MKIIAYGSLMNQKSLGKTLRRSVKLKKTNISGWCRIFNAPFDGYAFLNLRRVRGKTIEAAYFSISQNELKLFEKREKGSDLVEVKNGFFAFIWPGNKTKSLPVLESYLDVCEKGARRLRIDFWRNTAKPNNIINDLQHPKYLSCK